MQVTVGRLSFKVADTVHIPFWKQVNDGTWEPATYAVFDRLIDARSVVLDIGAWIGPTALYAAQLAKACYAFEPDPIAHAGLKHNLALNKDAAWSERLHLVKSGITASGGAARLGSQAAGGDSMSSLLFGESDTAWSIETMTLPRFVADFNFSAARLFIKMDIEGAEYDVLPSLKDFFRATPVTLFVSLYPGILRRALKRRHVGLDRVSRFFKARGESVRAHRRVFEALDSFRLERMDGMPLNARRVLAFGALTGRFPFEIVAIPNA